MSSNSVPSRVGPKGKAPDTCIGLDKHLTCTRLIPPLRRSLDGECGVSPLSDTLLTLWNMRLAAGDSTKKSYTDWWHVGRSVAATMPFTNPSHPAALSTSGVTFQSAAMIQGPTSDNTKAARAARISRLTSDMPTESTRYAETM